ncbi:nuclear transport factor 2 family protein [Streptomyces sp. RB6PN25]|uniref:Nuclear transport factor 2 family protein n=1 Tax=Streptomyces humicola TaxID=2953240 RepID=A0ABT1PTD8_9ACTN|nr:nuclear transport factor 2 family protein [Streptomyces humicola]MCQ4080393.1 nuclear transport factor 2 family protein [Streptomyces humicola]
MAEHPNATLVRRGYEAFSRADADTLSQIIAKDATYHSPGTHPLSGDHKGLDAVLTHFGRLAEETGGTLRVELRNLMVDGRGHVMAVHRVTAERGGKKLDQMGGIVFRIVGEKATDLDECVEDLDAVNEFWS